MSRNPDEPNIAIASSRAKPGVCEYDQIRIFVSEICLHTKGQLLMESKTCLYFLDEMSLAAALQVHLSRLKIKTILHILRVR